MPKTYLGDAVYAEYDGDRLILFAGDDSGSIIYLEPEVYAALVRFMKENIPDASS